MTSGGNYLYLVGNASNGFPTQTLTGAYNQSTYGGGFSDGFIIKINSLNQSVWSTYYGGSSTDYFSSCKTDNIGNLFVFGRTNSTNLPLQNPGGGAYYQNTLAGDYDFFIIKFDPSGVRQWATYLGGNGQERAASNDGIIGNSNGVFFIGSTTSTNMPVQDYGGSAFYQDTLGGNEDVFLFAVDNSMNLIWSTYMGGSSLDNGEAIAADWDGNIYITGTTKSSDFPTASATNAYTQSFVGGGSVMLGDAFLSAFDFSQLSLFWSTFIGRDNIWNDGSDVGYSLNCIQNTKIYLTGSSASNSPTYPLVDPSGGAYYQSSITNGAGVIISEFDLTSISVNIVESKKINFDCNFSIYPNPSEKTININNLMDINKKEIIICLYNTLGQIIYAETFKSINQNFSINIEKYESGIYFLSINNCTFKLIKQ